MTLRSPASHHLLIFLWSLLVSQVIAKDAGKIESLIFELSSDSFQIREQATNDLWMIGEGAAEALQEATLSKDPEMAFRAAEVLRKVELRITPETPDEILSLIRSFRDSTIRQKSALLQKLRSKKAYYQSLKLFSMESPEVKEELASRVRGVAIAGARESILKDDIQTAIELLRLSSSDGNHSDLMALACLYRSTGTLDEQMAELDPPQNVTEVIWKSFLLRADGDLQGAIAHAKEHDQQRLLAGLQILAGDPTLWLEYNGWGEKSRTALPTYINIVLKRWNGERVNELDFKPLHEQINLGERNQTSAALSALSVLGEIDAVEKYQKANQPNAAFLYHLSREEIPKALEAIGLDTKEPDYAGWVAQRFETIGNGEAEGDQIAELQMLVGFMERRGLQRELKDAFSKPLEEYQKENEPEFLNFLGSFFDSGSEAGDFATDSAASWAGEDPERWKRVYEIALGDQDLVFEWLQWILEIKPDMTKRETLESLRAILKQSYNPKRLRLRMMKLVWSVVDETEDADLKEKYLKRIISLSTIQQDVTNAIKAWDQLSPEAQQSTRWGSIDKYLSAMGRWEEVAEMFEDNDRISKASEPEIHAYYAAVLRKAGFEEKARTHDRMADKLALGYAPSGIRIAADYAFCDDTKRASDWLMRAAIQADVTDIEFISAIAKYGESALNERDWKVAAACYETVAQYYASQNYIAGALTDLSKVRLNADLARAMSILPGNRAAALEILETIHKHFKTDATLADHFFPALRNAGLTDQLNEWFSESWNILVGVIETYPASHNTRNSAAWLASRAGSKLREAKAYQEVALALTPEQPAYLDTMGELHFALGDPQSAIKWSNKAVRFAPFEGMIRMQNFRFRGQN